MPGWAFPVDVNIQTEPALGIAALRQELETLRDQYGPAWRARNASRHPAVAATDAAEPTVDGQIPVAVLGAALSALLEPDDIVVEEATTNFATLRESLDRTRPGTYFRSGGSGLGWGLPGALGIKLGRPERRVVSIVGDGAFLFGSPVATLWAMHANRAPVLTVVLQNGGYAASRAPVFQLFPDAPSTRSNSVVGTLIDSPPNLAGIAQACHAFGANVRQEDLLLPTLRTACARVDRGQAAVVVVHVPSPWI
jgi:acetolactate synthase-1/2/3 large subunit